MSEERVYPPISEEQWVKILGDRKFRILVKPEQLEWAGTRAVRCINCSRAASKGLAGGHDPWRAYCLENLCMVSNAHPKLCRQYTTAEGLQPYAVPQPLTRQTEGCPGSGVRGEDVAVAAFPEKAHGARDTSITAYRALEYSGRLTRQQRLIMDFLEANAQRDFTRQELGDALGFGINVICGRVNELAHEPLELVEETERRKCRITGETANALRARASRMKAAA